MAVTKNIITFFGIITIVTGQLNFPGKCPNVTTQRNFDMQKYAGSWYEIEKFPTVFQNGARCLRTKYTPGKNNTFRAENFMSLYGANLTVAGTIEEINPKLKDGKLRVTLPSVDLYNSEIWVLSTDYTNYAIVWNCNQVNNSNDQFAWALSRTPNMTQAQYANVTKYLEANHISLEKLVPVNQTDCGSHSHGHRNSGSDARVSVALVAFAIFTTWYNLC